MRPTDVLAKIEETYTDCWQYYQVYAEALIEENRTDKLFEVFRKCMNNCALREEELRHKFG